MNFVVIFGPPAVGKMTVGYALSHLTGFKLFHNHMTIELVLNFFPHGHPQHKRLVRDFRQRLFEEVATSDLSGLIFTCLWDLASGGAKAQIDGFAAIFHAAGWQTYYVELAADQEERIRRNRSAFRLEQKPSKRNTAGSENYLRQFDQLKKLNTADDFYYPERYIKIDNTTLAPELAAQCIIDAFGFSTISA